MVLTVCRRVLHHVQDAEDAFQATFLLLAGKAASLSRRESLAGWLHGVAYRMATNARRAAIRRQQHEERVPVMHTAKPESEVAWREAQEILQREIQRLPALYRDVFVLCCLESRSGAEAARALGIKEATLRSRLAKARALLQRSLARRGVSLSAALAAAALTADAAKAAVSPGLIASTVRAAALVAAGKPLTAGAVSAGVVTLLKGAKMALFTAKLKAATLVILSLTVAGVGIGLGASRQETPAAVEERPAVSAVPQPRPRGGAPTPVEAGGIDEAGRTGRTVGPDRPPPGGRIPVAPAAGGARQGTVVPPPIAGEPAVLPVTSAPGMAVPVGVAPGGPGGPIPVGVAPAGPGGIAIPTVRGTIVGPDGGPPTAATVTAVYSDHTVSGLHTTDGRFDLPVGRLTVNGRGPAAVEPEKLVGVAVAADGFGFGWADAAVAARGGPVIRLVKDLAIRGRILDAKGRPVEGAKVRVEEVRAYPADNLKGVLSALHAKGRASVTPSTWVVPPEWAGPVPGQPVGGATITGPDGRFRLTRLGGGRVVRLRIAAPGEWPVGVTVLTFAPGAGDPPLPEKDDGRPVHLAEFEHQLAPGGR